MRGDVRRACFRALGFGVPKGRDNDSANSSLARLDEGAFGVCVLWEEGFCCDSQRGFPLSGPVAVVRNDFLGFREAGSLTLALYGAFIASERSKKVDDDEIELLPDIYCAWSWVVLILVFVLR